MPTDAPSDIHVHGPRKYWAVTALMCGAAVATLDTAIANIALPTIATDLQISADRAVWIINAYQLSMVAALVPLATLGDRIGHRNIYVFGMVLFTGASLACGLASTFSMLVAARMLQGVGAAGILGVVSALLRLIFPPHQTGRAQGLNAMTVAIFFVIGPTLTSIILSFAGWPWLFLINIPLGVLTTALAMRVLPPNSCNTQRHTFDAVAAMLLAAMLSLTVFSLGELAHHASPANVAMEIGVVVLCFVLLLRRQRGHPAPILPVDLFRLPFFSLSMLTSILSYAAQGMAFVALPFLFATKLGRSAVEIGFLFTPWPIFAAITAPIAGYLCEKLSTAVLGSIGLLILCIGLACTSQLNVGADISDIAWPLAICGAGFGFFQSPNLKALAMSVPKERIGSASGLIPTGRLLGQALGTALVAAHLASSIEHGAGIALWTASALSGIASVVSFFRTRCPETSNL
ncbi:MFS transporter [Pseudorhodoferax sp.]|uniref:MFS transporter n=1 Tax=Pseudorhodoferax sp. TaxID=1993553 RepID=UPI0039E2C0E5